jgi:hypothetical protein|tara:strand:+ start:539 stop:970 length:432 start_codon:yes stop_codon:yes gene_type:complete
MQYDTPHEGDNAMNDEERVFRLTRRDGVIYWSGSYDHAEQFLYPPADRAGVAEEVRHLSIADAFDAAKPAAGRGDTMRRIVADVIASLEKNAVFQTEGEPDGRPYLKTRPLSEILDEIESRISPEIRELEVRDGEIVRKEPGR